jgi:hypothetical protein
MKTLVIFILFFSLINFVSGQNNVQEIAFIEKNIREYQSEGSIYYSEKISKKELNNIKEKIQVQSIYDHKKADNKNYLNLTRQEKKYLMSQLEICCTPTWQDDLFKDSKIVKSDDIVSYIKTSYTEYLEKYNNPNNSEEERMTMVKNYQRPNVFTFSKPVYLRDETLFFFYFSSTCGDPCGFEEFSFYKKENNEWKKWIVVERKDF